MVGANEICRMDAVNLARRIRAKELSPTEVIEAVLTRMEALEPHLHAFCTTTPDLARREAKRVEKAILTGEDVGPLAGVPVGIKDLVCTAGIRTVSGSFAYQNFVPDEDDVVVERLKEADAIIIGKTNVPEFGYSAVGHSPVFETTRNPWNVERTSGGSSAGSGAGGRSRDGPLRNWERWRRINPYSRGALWPLRHEGVDGASAALSGHERRALSRRFELGIA
jgi:aspartyl-tRNA(Asn)/glutamyl-tRNA(Gln) amidotransferase subunit A